MYPACKFPSTNKYNANLKPNYQGELTVSPNCTSILQRQSYDWTVEPADSQQQTACVKTGNATFLQTWGTVRFAGRQLNYSCPAGEKQFKYAHKYQKQE